MSNLIPFHPRPSKPVPTVEHVLGTALCLECDHQWLASVPAGTVRIECPNCRLLRGALYAGIEYDMSDSRWECRCGGFLFIFTEIGTRCWRCGRMQVFDPNKGA